MVLCKKTWPTRSRNKEHQRHWHSSFHPQIKSSFWWKTVTYGKFVCNIKPYKEEHCRTRLTLGGNLLDYIGNLSTNTASVTTAKCLLNISISTPACNPRDIVGRTAGELDKDTCTPLVRTRRPAMTPRPVGRTLREVVPTIRSGRHRWKLPVLHYHEIMVI